MKHAQFISQRTNLWKSNYKRLPHSKSLSQVTDSLHPNPAKLQESFNSASIPIINLQNFHFINYKLHIIFTGKKKKKPESLISNSSN